MVLAMFMLTIGRLSTQSVHAHLEVHAYWTERAIWEWFNAVTMLAVGGVRGTCNMQCHETAVGLLQLGCVANFKVKTDARATKPCR